LARLSLVLAIAFLSSVARADEADALNLKLSTSISYDSNVFRLSDNTDSSAVIGSEKRSDLIMTTSLSATFEERIGRQRISLAANISRVKYDRFEYLDYTGRDLKAIWNWVLGNDLYGELGRTRRASLSDFGDFRLPVKNIYTVDSNNAAMNWQMVPDWLFRLGASHDTGTNSATVHQSSNYEADTREFGLRYTPRSGNWVGVRFSRMDVTYPNRIVVSGQPVDSSLTQDDSRLNFNWQASGASHITGDIGRTRRRRPDVPNRDFSGPTGRLSWDWLATGKLMLNFSAGQELGELNELNASYYVLRRTSISSTWAPTAKMTLQAMFEHRHRHNQGERATVADPLLSLIVDSLPTRDDVTNTQSLSWTYQAMRALQFDLSLRNERNQSNYSSQSYRDHTAYFGAVFSY